MKTARPETGAAEGIVALRRSPPRCDEERRA